MKVGEAMYEIIFEDVYANYGNIRALENVSLTIKENDFLGIIGPNGGGKTTLLKLLLGLIKPLEGKVTKGRGTKVAYVPQFSTFNKEFPIGVLDVVMMGTLERGVKPFYKYSKADKVRVEKILDDIGIGSLRGRSIAELSGGQLQKVLIARALATEANVLILDEPTASLDAEAKGDIYELLKEINKRATIVLVSHDIGVISSYVKNVACLNKKLFYHGKSEGAGDSLSRAYGCPIDLIAHGFPHRVFEEHGEVDADD